MRKLIPYILLLLLLPLLWLNVKNSHDWGDDFAQYLIQAKNIVEGKSQTDNGLIFDNEAGRFAVSVYPVGLPLLLSPVVAVSGIQIKPLLLLESLFLIILGMLSFQFFRKYFSDIVSVLLALFLCYHSLTLELKSQVLSEIPFTIFLLSIFLVLRSEGFNLKKCLLLGFLCAFLASLRIVGVLIIPAIALYLLQKYLREKDHAKALEISRTKIFMIISLSGTIIFLLLNVILFNISLSTFFGFYLDANRVHETDFTNNLLSYYEQLAYTFNIPYSNMLRWSPVCTLLILIGFVQDVRKNTSPVSWFLLLYLGVIGLYPYTSGGFRFLFPIFPILILYFFEGIRTLIEKTGSFVQRSILIVTSLLLLYSQYYPLKQILKQDSSITEGPQDADSQEMFAFISNKTSINAVVAFPRARAMSLYGNRSATYLLKTKSGEENVALFEKLHVSHVVADKGNPESPLYDPALLNYLQYDHDNLRIVWENEGYTVYQLLKQD